MCVKETLERVLREKLKGEPLMDLQGIVEYLNVSKATQKGNVQKYCI